MDSNEIERVIVIPPRFGAVVRQARRARRLTLCHLADQVLKEDGTPISPQYLFDIEVHFCVPAPDVLREMARGMELEYDTLLALTGAVDTLVREYLAAHPQHTDVVVKLFRAAQQREFHDWDQLLELIDVGSTSGALHGRLC